MTTNREWLEQLASNDIPALDAWMDAEHVEGYPKGDAHMHDYEEFLYEVDVSDCPYCGCERVVVHDHSECYERPDSYRVEHLDVKEACTADCFDMYFSFGSAEDAVRHADMRACGDEPWYAQGGVVPAGSVRWDGDAPVLPLSDKVLDKIKAGIEEREKQLGQFVCSTSQLQRENEELRSSNELMMSRIEDLQSELVQARSDREAYRSALGKALDHANAVASIAPTFDGGLA